MKRLVISVVLANLLVACGSEPTKPDTPPAQPPKTEAPKLAPPPVAVTPASVVDPINDPKNYPLLAKRSVYYPLDVYAVQDADKPVVQAHAKYLSEYANRKTRLEGNCDERGSNEYNLGLGQRRADGVKKMLELGGARAGQVDSVSYGEEKPKSSGHDEAAWAQNRRTDLIYAK
jgi:peptidoglycan-associated lipoprotein